jgi:hypothetical protein
MEDRLHDLYLKFQKKDSCSLKFQTLLKISFISCAAKDIAHDEHH